ncbi:hypothetical protein ABN097_15210 [Enterobacter cloacae]|uniref:hypothetical protein n=1 Tax=Enterobacter cloacae TaxID=550 RepID=UPI0032DBA008
MNPPVTNVVWNCFRRCCYIRPNHHLTRNKRALSMWSDSRYNYRRMLGRKPFR